MSGIVATLVVLKTLRAAVKAALVHRPPILVVVAAILLAVLTLPALLVIIVGL